MKKSIRLAAVAATALGMVALGFSVANATGTTGKVNTPHVTNTVPTQFVPHAGAGTSPRPPSRPDSIYVPIKNCRLVSTGTAGGFIANNATRSFSVVGNGNFTGQGGPSTGCGIPVSATAVSARVTANGAKANGAFIAYPTGTPVGQGTLYYAKGVNTTTGATLQLGSGTGKVLTVKNVQGPANLIIDVNGYYDEQMEGMIGPGGTIYAGSNHIVSATNPSAGYYVVTLDHDVTYCTPTVTTYSGHVYGSAYAFNGNNVVVHTWYLSSTTHTEVDTNYYVYLTLTC